MTTCDETTKNTEEHRRRVASPPTHQVMYAESFLKFCELPQQITLEDKTKAQNNVPKDQKKTSEEQPKYSRRAINTPAEQTSTTEEQPGPMPTSLPRYVESFLPNL